MPLRRAADAIVMDIRADNQEKGHYVYDFANMRDPHLPFSVTREHLKTADYTVHLPDAALPQNRIVIERKSLDDLYGTLGNETRRKRFKAEFERMSLFGYAAVVIEATLEQILRPNDYLDPRYATKLNPRSAYMTLMFWSQRYGVHIWMMPGRRVAEQWTFRLLECWTRDHYAKLAQRAIEAGKHDSTRMGTVNEN